MYRKYEKEDEFITTTEHVQENVHIKKKIKYTIGVWRILNSMYNQNSTRKPYILKKATRFSKTKVV